MGPKSSKTIGVIYVEPVPSHLGVVYGVLYPTFQGTGEEFAVIRGDLSR